MKKVRDAILDLQAVLLIPAEKRASTIGPLSRASFERLAVMDPLAEWGPADAAAAVVESVVVGPMQGIRHVSDNGLAFVKEFEGLFLKAYLDNDDGGGVWTIGYGHTGLQHNDGTVYKGRTITAAKAEELLSYDMRQFEARVSTLVKPALNQDQFDALVSFDFNTGGLREDGKDSTMLKLLNLNRFPAAAAEFPKWNHDNGKVVSGLTRRRASERNLFEGKRPFIVQA